MMCRRLAIAALVLGIGGVLGPREVAAKHHPDRPRRGSPPAPDDPSDVRAVPEPSALVLMGTAGLGLAAYGWSRRRHRAG